MIDDALNTRTVQDQRGLEQKLIASYAGFRESSTDEQLEDLTLQRDAHVEFLLSGLGALPQEYISLDASRTWLVYWILHSLALLGAPPPVQPTPDEILEFLKRCQGREGGYGGGPGQIPHLAATYAAVAATLTIGGPNALASVKRRKMMDFILEMCVSPKKGGGMMVHAGGEVDVRGCYTGIAVAHMLNLDKDEIVHASGMAEYVRACQSHEGGLGGEPGNEAHGGYTFCGLAALVLAGRADVLDLPRLLHWVVAMQGSIEGGFMGRTNKLVDGCYSYWQGAILPLMRLLKDEVSRQLPVPAFLRCCGDENIDKDPGQELGFDVPEVPDLPTLPRALDPLEQTQTAQQKKLENLTEWLQQSVDAGSGLSSMSPDLSTQQDEPHNMVDTDSIRESVQDAKDTISAADASTSRLFPSPLTDAVVNTIPSAQDRTSIYNSEALQFWILKSCQSRRGGLKDKPGKSPDYYHTCYCLSGLSVSQHYSGVVLGPPDNLLVQSDPTMNIVQHKLAEAIEFYNGQPL